MGCLAALVHRWSSIKFFCHEHRITAFIWKTFADLQKTFDRSLLPGQTCRHDRNKRSGHCSSTELVASMSKSVFRELIQKSPPIDKKTHVSESSTNFGLTVLCDNLCFPGIWYQFFDIFSAENSFLIFSTFLVLTFVTVFVGWNVVFPHNLPTKRSSKWAVRSKSIPKMKSDRSVDKIPCLILIQHSNSRTKQISQISHSFLCQNTRNLDPKMSKLWDLRSLRMFKYHTWNLVYRASRFHFWDRFMC